MVEQRLDAENTITTSVQPGRIEETSISNHYNPITDSHGPRMQNGNNMPLTGGDPGYMTAPADTPAFTSSNFPSMGSFPNSINSGGQTYSDSANMSNTEEHSMEHGGHLSGRIWSDTKTKAGKERKRLPLACISCRRKKIKCSGEKPSCAHCLRSRTPCVYKQAARKAVSSRVDYMTMIDRRLKRMEDQLIKHIPREEVGGMLATTGRSVAKPAPVHHASQRGGKRSSYVAFGDAELDAWASQPSRNELPTDNKPHAENPTKPSSASAENEGWSILPSKEVQEHLTEVYFDYVYGQAYFLLHKPSFLRRLRSNLVPPVLILAVCAVSARFSKHPLVRHNPSYLAGEVWAQEAERIVLKHYDDPTLTSLTACLLLGLHHLGTCQGGRSWALGGMATRMAFALQLHKEQDDNPLGTRSDDPKVAYVSFTDRELRRRVMWACFVMDRFNSSGTARPPVIQAFDIDVQLPNSDRNLELDIPAITENLDGTTKGAKTNPELAVTAKENMNVAAYMVKVVAQFGKVIKYLNLGGKDKDEKPPWDAESQFAELVRNTQKLSEELPPNLRYNEENLLAHTAEKMGCQFLFVHIGFQQILLFLHRFSFPQNPSIFPEDSPPPPEFLSASAQIAIDAAEYISQLLAKAQEKNYTLVAPFMGYCAFTSATVHVVRAFAPDKATRDLAKRYLGINLRYLGTMSRYWGFLGFLTDGLRKQYTECSQAYQSGQTPAGAPKRIVQYGDWFQKYPKGVKSPEEEAEEARMRSEMEDATLGLRSNLTTADGFFSKHSPTITSNGRTVLKSGPNQAKKQKESPEQRKDSLSLITTNGQRSLIPMPQTTFATQILNDTSVPSQTQAGLNQQDYMNQPQAIPTMAPMQPTSQPQQHSVQQTQFAQPLPPQQQQQNPAFLPSQAFLYNNYSRPFAVSTQPQQNLMSPAGAVASPTSVPWGFEMQSMNMDEGIFENNGLANGTQWFAPFNIDLSGRYDLESPVDGLMGRTNTFAN